MRAERLSIVAPDGVRLEGIHVPAITPSRPDAAMILGFAGNASNAQGIAELLHEIYPGHGIVAFHYRGYAPSGGAPGARELLDDAPLVFDLVARRYRPRAIVAVGISLGSGVAAGLASRRPLAGLILVTPFDSLQATARQLHPWLPVKLLLRHDIASAELLRGVDIPVAIVAAANDRLVRPERTAALRQSLENLVFEALIPSAAHNDIALKPDFEPAMRAALTEIEAAARSSAT